MIVHYWRFHFGLCIFIVCVICYCYRQSHISNLKFLLRMLIVKMRCAKSMLVISWNHHTSNVFSNIQELIKLFLSSLFIYIYTVPFKSISIRYYSLLPTYIPLFKTFLAYTLWYNFELNQKFLFCLEQLQNVVFSWFFLAL